MLVVKHNCSFCCVALQHPEYRKGSAALCQETAARKNLYSLSNRGGWRRSAAAWLLYLRTCYCSNPLSPKLWDHMPTHLHLQDAVDELDADAWLDMHAIGSIISDASSNQAAGDTTCPSCRWVAHSDQKMITKSKSASMMTLQSAAAFLSEALLYCTCPVHMQCTCAARLCAEPCQLQLRLQLLLALRRTVSAWH